MRSALSTILVRSVMKTKISCTERVFHKTEPPGSIDSLQGTICTFLDANNLPYEVEPSGGALPSADIAARARDFTVRVECWK